MTHELTLGDIAIDVVFKDIKNVHLSVYPPEGRVRMAAPARMNLDTLRIYAISKLGWIRDQQRKLRGQARETEREYLDRESHYVWGERFLLTVLEQEAAPSVTLQHRRLLLSVRPGSSPEHRQAVIDAWYRAQLRQAAAPLIANWETVMGVRVAQVHVQRMKTRWGSCSPARASIRLNTDLAKKPPRCLEYIVAHEMTHLLEPSHNARFVALMDQFMPAWRHHRDLLNRLPLGHEDWAY
jgi:predicted metal-dependent hydrolase